MSQQFLLLMVVRYIPRVDCGDFIGGVLSAINNNVI